MTEEQLMAWRVRHDVTQREAAALCGVTLRAWQRWEYGERAVSPPVCRLLYLLDTIAAARGALVAYRR